MSAREKAAEIDLGAGGGVIGGHSGHRSRGGQPVHETLQRGVDSCRVRTLRIRSHDGACHVAEDLETERIIEVGPLFHEVGNKSL